MHAMGTLNGAIKTMLICERKKWYQDRQRCYTGKTLLPYPKFLVNFHLLGRSIVIKLLVQCETDIAHRLLIILANCTLVVGAWQS